METILQATPGPASVGDGKVFVLPVDEAHRDPHG